uniref:Ankyrin-repeat protein n=1 Tax=Tetraselmis sp. GSL018 TaxID=582737 RepID=A0A061SL75_9CHLO
MPDILDLLSFAEVGDIDSSKAFLEWSERNYEAIGATLARKDAVVGRTALHRAAENGHADYVKWLLGKGVDHLQPDNSGVTALHLAAIKGHVEVCKILLSHDTNGALAVQKPNDKGETAVHWAALSGNVDALMLLLQTCGAAARSLTDSRGNTPLHCAAMNNREAAVASLLSANADPAARNSAGDTPLHTAARSGALAAIYAFLPHLPVARRAVCNAEGQTPMDVGGCAVPPGDRQARGHRFQAQVRQRQRGKRGEAGAPPGR